MPCRFTSATPGTTDTRIGFAFTPRAWDGEPVNAEPHKHSELIWVSLGFAAVAPVVLADSSPISVVAVGQQVL
jgi:hypothetical protein